MVNFFSPPQTREYGIKSWIKTIILDFSNTKNNPYQFPSNKSTLIKGRFDAWKLFIFHLFFP
ncbi:hypothetical protein DHD08_18260 [Arenibacter sp. H213]|nr:hypothetical protein [Arenibacter sp. H213]